MNTQKIILKNSIVTPDGTVLVSRHRHDYVSHDDANGNTYAIDGGLAYVKISGNISDCDINTVYNTDDHTKIREEFEWGTYGKHGDQELSYVLLKDMESDHILAILKTQTHLSNEVLTVFEAEIGYRVNNTTPH